MTSPVILLFSVVRAWVRPKRKWLSLVFSAVGLPCCITLVILSTTAPEFTAASAPFSGTSYTGTALSLPGRIEAENFDHGGESVAYHDTSAANEGGFYRSEGVDDL